MEKCFIRWKKRRNEKEKGTKMKDEKYETIYENLNTKDRLK